MLYIRSLLYYTVDYYYTSKTMSTSRKSMPRKSTAEKKLILKVDKWLEEPMTRDRLNQRTGTTDRIFEKPNRAEMCAEICDVSKYYVIKLKSGRVKR